MSAAGDPIVSDTAAEHMTHLRAGALRPDVEHADSPNMLSFTQLAARATVLLQAWSVYRVQAVLPPLFTIISIFYLIDSPVGWYAPQVLPLQNVGGGWSFVAGMVCIALSGPVAFYVRRHYWD